jgi:uncharacterized membrane protein
MVAGTVAAALAGLAGFLAFFTVPDVHTETAHDLMLWHLGLNVVGLVLFTGLSIVRWRARASVPSDAARILGGVVLGVLLFSSYLGGEIVYKGGTGIDPNILRADLHHHGHAHEPGTTVEHQHEHEGHEHTHEGSTP